MICGKSSLFTLDSGAELNSQVLYKRSSSSLKVAEENLLNCGADSSPAYDKTFVRLSAAKSRLNIIQERWDSNGSTPASHSESSGIILKICRMLIGNSSQEEMDFNDLSNIFDESEILVMDATETTTRREENMPLYDIVSSQLLPDEERLSKSTKTQGLLKPKDRVKIDQNVKIKEGSYLDSFKYQLSGPKLLVLAQKAINCRVAAQNPVERLKKHKGLLIEMAKDIQRIVIQLARDMRDSPDDMSRHLEYIDQFDKIIGPLLDELQKPPKHFYTRASGLQRTLLETESSFKATRTYRPRKEPIEDFLEANYEITLIVNEKKYVHKKKDLTWEYVRTKVLPPLSISEIAVSDIWRAPHAEGGFSETFSARLSNGKMVALKRIIGRESDSEDVLCLRFVREVFIWWKAGKHPNIHQFLGICFMDNTNIPTMVSSWCTDGNLATYVRRPMSLTRAEELKLALQVARGLQHLHSRKIFHGDMKPNNILIEDGQAMIHDFGISRIEDDAQRLSTQTHGSYTYQAPELLKALRQPVKPHACATAESDIYSFGNVLFECLTKQVPFSQLKSIDEIPNTVLKEFKRPLHPDYKVKLDGEGKEELVRLMKDCWHRDPAPRPSADQVVRRLEEIEKNIMAIGIK